MGQWRVPETDGSLAHVQGVTVPHSSASRGLLVFLEPAAPGLLVMR